MEIFPFYKFASSDVLFPQSISVFKNGRQYKTKNAMISLGVNDAPIAVPSSVCVQAARANRFSIIGALMNPRKQNMRALINQLPRLWGMENNVVGRIIDARKFQFVFQSEESLNLILRRGPWSFSEWMLVTHRHVPHMAEEQMKIIPFWTQIHGIPAQYLTTEMIDVIGSSLGHVSGIDFDESATRVDYVRVRLDWNIDMPLRFKRNFTFGHDENVILSFRYERLRNFCVICGMITHDKKECPLRFDVDEDDHPDFPDEDDDFDKEKREDESLVIKHDATKVETQETVPRRINPSIVAGPSKMSEADSEKSFSLIMNRDLTAETWYYLQAKRAKGKFTDEDFLDVLHKYSCHDAAKSNPGKRLRDVEETESPYYKTSSGIKNDDEKITQGVPSYIPGIDTGKHNQSGVLMSDFSQGLAYLMQQTEQERASMIYRFKQGFKKNEYVDAFDEYIENEECVLSFKKRKTEPEMKLQTPNQTTIDRMGLNSIKKEIPEESEGSCEVLQRIDGGTGGPVPPPVP